MQQKHEFYEMRWDQKGDTITCYHANGTPYRDINVIDKRKFLEEYNKASDWVKNFNPVYVHNLYNWENPPKPQLPLEHIAMGATCLGGAFTNYLYCYLYCKLSPSQLIPPIALITNLGFAWTFYKLWNYERDTSLEGLLISAGHKRPAPKIIEISSTLHNGRG